MRNGVTPTPPCLWCVKIGHFLLQDGKIFTSVMGRGELDVPQLLLSTDMEIHLNLALQCPGPKDLRVPQQLLQEGPACSSHSSVPSTEGLCCLPSVDSFSFFFSLSYENAAVLSWMDEYLAELLLKIQINSLSLVFMNHNQERSSALKGHFVNMSPVLLNILLTPGETPTFTNIF